MAIRNKNRKSSAWLPILGVSVLGFFTLLFAWLVRDRDIALLNPKGAIADEQTRLLILTTSIMLAFAAMVLFFIYFFAWKYRESNDKTEYTPGAGRSKALVAVAWISPIIIFITLAAIMLPATQKLEPQRSIESDKEELTVRVIAMRWKWVFMYPEQDIATVNFAQIPVDTPVRFELTADEAPMQGFWIPHLGGMLYAMTEHVNPLNLISHTPGDYNGGASEINGHGFAGMRFVARVSTEEEFEKWVDEARHSENVLDEAEYARLLEPSEDTPATIYSSPDNQALFKTLLQKYAGSHDHYSEETEDGGHNH